MQPLSFRKSGVNVTDLSSQLWCEKQLEFSLYLGREKTKKMIQGEKIHEDLQKEVVDIIEVSPLTFHDFLALKLINMNESINILLSQGLIREIPVLGKVNKLFIKGLIDELIIKENKIILLDTKTRHSDSMPSKEQVISAEFQLTLYKFLLDNLRQGNFNYIHFMKYYNLKYNNQISDEFSKELNLEDKNIMSLAKKTFLRFEELPEISDNLVLRYRYKDNIIKEHNFTFDQDKFIEIYNFIEEYWLEKRPALRTTNLWKCNHCEFKQRCWNEES